IGEPQRGQNACRRGLPLSAVVLRYVAGWPVMRKVAPGTGTLTRKAEPVLTWQSVQWQTVVFSGSASPSTLMYPQWHAPSIFMSSFLFLDQAQPTLHRRRFSRCPVRSNLRQTQFFKVAQASAVTPNFSKCLRLGDVRPSPRFTVCALDALAIISPDRVPLGLTKMNSDFQERIIAILQEFPNGLTSTEIAGRLGDKPGTLTSRLSKMAAYGIIGKTRYSRGPRGNVYRALTNKQATVWSPAP